MVESINNVVSLNRNYTGRFRDIPRYLNTQATTMDTEASVNTERLRQLQDLLQATEDADATATAIRFAENYF